MQLKFAVIILIIAGLKLAKSDKNACRIKRDVLKNELDKLQKAFNITKLSLQPERCSDYQNSIVQIVEGINYEKSLTDIEQSPEYQEVKEQYLLKEQEIEGNHLFEKNRLEDEFASKMQEVRLKIENTMQEISSMKTNQGRLIKDHSAFIERFSKCDEELKTTFNPYYQARRFGAPRSSPKGPVLCIVTHQWLQELKTLADTKVLSSFSFSMSDDCTIKRKWFMDITNIFMEANQKIVDSFSLEAYKFGLEKRLSDRKKTLDDLLFQLSQEHQRDLKAATDRLQDLNLDLQMIKQNLIKMKAQQRDELEQLGVKLIECNHFDLVLQLIDEVESKSFMKAIITKEYEMSTNDDKADRIMKFIARISQVCRKFEAFLTLYDALKGSSHMQSPTIIEVIEQIRELRFKARDCRTEYNVGDFLSTTLATDPSVDKILDVLSDSIKIGSFDKIVTFNYYYPLTFGKILPTLVGKSYTGNNLDILLKFKDELYWLLHKYDVLDKLLIMNPPRTEKNKKLFMESVKKTMQTDTRYSEHDDRMEPLKNKMKRNGMKI
ncbi:hypothetical protein ACKWTF_014144 [Chironomus riparius]